MAKEKTCLFCGTSYNYCPTCREYSRYPLWMSSFDTERCHDMYEVMGGYVMGIKTKEDIQAVLDKHGITDYSVFSKKLQAKLETILCNVYNKEDAKDTVEETPVVENIDNEKKYSPRRKRSINRKLNYENEANTEE